MTRISSNLTLFYKFFIPTFWVGFVGACTIAFWRLQLSSVAGISIQTFRIVITVTYLLGLLFLYWSSMRLKRVELDRDFLYVTNYFKHLRYPLHDIEKIEEVKRPLFPVSRVHLKSKGTFGQILTYVPVKNRLQEFVEEIPGLNIKVE